MMLSQDKNGRYVSCVLCGYVLEPQSNFVPEEIDVAPGRTGPRRKQEQKL